MSCAVMQNLSLFILLWQSRREYEQQVANEEAEQLRSFHVSNITNKLHALSVLSNS
jgi:hypothetical protein